MLDALKALRTLEQIEGERGQLYERLGELCLGNDAASTLFARLGLDQLSRRNVIQYQTRIVLKNSGVFRAMQLPQNQIDEIASLVSAWASHDGPLRLSEAADIVYDLETRSLELYQGEFFTQLEVHFAPFVANLRRGCERHLQQLRQLLREEPAPTPVAERLGIVNPKVGGSVERTVPPEAVAPGLLQSVTRADGGLLVAILERLQDGAYLVDGGGKILYWNPAAARIAGYSPEEMTGCRCWDNGLCHIDGEGKECCHDACPVQLAMENGTTVEAQVYLRHRHGHRVPVDVVIHPVKGPAGEVRGAVHVFRENATGALCQEKIAQLEKIAYLDQLTGLGNRRFVEQTILSRLNALQRHGWRFGLLFLDVNRFKEVNERYGQAVGDQVLQMVGRTLSSNVRMSDLAGRWGGDEFVVAVSGEDQTHLQLTADKLEMLIERSELAVNGDIVRITVTVAAIDARPEDTIDNLIGRGEELMHGSGRESRFVFEPSPPTGEPVPEPIDGRDFAWEVLEALPPTAAAAVALGAGSTSSRPKRRARQRR